MKNLKGKLTAAAELILWVVFFSAFTCIVISETQVFKDIFFYIAASSLLLFVMLVRKIKLFSWYNLLIMGVYGAASLNWLYVHRFDWGYQYATMLALRFLMNGLFLLIVLDIVVTGRKAVLQLRKPVFAIIVFVAFGVAIVYGLENILIVLCPVLAWYFTPMSRKQWDRTLLVIARAAYVAFLIIMTASFVIAPNKYEAGRYIGFFTFPAAGGLLEANAIVAVLYHWHCFSKTVADKKKNNLLHASALIYPVVSSILTFDRAAWLALLCVLMIVFIFKRKDRKIIRRRSIIVGTLVVALTIVFCVSLKIMIASNMDYIEVSTNASGDFEYGANAYWVNIINKALIKGSKTGVFHENTLLNALDGFSSGRLGIWYTGLNQVKMIGPTELAMTLPNGVYMGHVHNTYIDWCMRLGYVGGILLITWFIAFIVKVVKFTISGDESVIYPLLWLAFCFGFFMVERELWTNLPPFMLLIMQYPLLMRFTDEKYDSETNIEEKMAVN